MEVSIDRERTRFHFFTLETKRDFDYIGIYRKVASTNASRFVTRLVYMHTQNDNFLIRSPS